MLDRIETLVSQFERKEISRRQLIGAIVAATGAVGGSAAPAAAAEKPVFQGYQLNHLTLGVKDINRSRAFYERLLGVRMWYDGTAQGFFDMGLDGPSFISVSQTLAPGVMNHYCVGIKNFDVDRAAADVKKAFPEMNPQPQKVSRVNGKPLAWPSFIVSDPDGNRLQLGDMKYQLDGRR